MRTPHPGEYVDWYDHGDESSKPSPALVLESNSDGVLTVSLIAVNAHYMRTFSGVRHMSRMSELTLPTRAQTGGWKHTKRNDEIEDMFAKLTARIEELESLATADTPKKRQKAEASA